MSRRSAPGHWNSAKIERLLLACNHTPAASSPSHTLPLSSPMAKRAQLPHGVRLRLRTCASSSSQPSFSVGLAPLRKLSHAASLALLVDAHKQAHAARIALTKRASEPAEHPEPPPASLSPLAALVLIGASTFALLPRQRPSASQPQQSQPAELQAHSSAQAFTVDGTSESGQRFMDRALHDPASYHNDRAHESEQLGDDVQSSSAEELWGHETMRKSLQRYESWKRKISME